MSLTTFLLGACETSDKKKAIDTELDALFQSQATLKLDRPESTLDGHHTVEKKRRRGVGVHADEPGSKRSKRVALASDATSSSISSPGKPKTDRVKIVAEPVSERGVVDVGQSGCPKNISSDVSGPESGEDHPSALVHETLEKEKPSKLADRKTRRVREDETKEVRDARTIFIGNLAPDVALKRVSGKPEKTFINDLLVQPLKKQLHQHILVHVPTAKIESTRFRSVAFQTPTSKLPEADDDAKRKKEPRQHDRDRASSWRDAHATDKSETNAKKFLTPSQKKKIAFINGDIHSDAGSVHAYVVFAHPTRHTRPSNLPPLPPVMDPFEAARLVIERCNGTMFLDRMLRVDAVAKKSTTDNLSDGTLPNSFIADPKLTVFVGNLDFASKEEDLRLFFEGVVSKERGVPDTAGSQDMDKQKHWVTRVRMVRDKDTQLGKGFAYVQFSDRTCVDEVLALEPDKLKFAKRKLRVQRCKSMPSATTLIKRDHASPSKKPLQTSTRTSVPPVPKGDPSLGDKLVELSKEERKRVKAADTDRVVRRMAKKKARLALAKQGVPLQNQHKDRQRVRKSGTAKRVGSTHPKKTNKGRVRSEKSMAKRNAKK